jgi:hypothetical protein
MSLGKKSMTDIEIDQTRIGGFLNWESWYHLPITPSWDNLFIEETNLN